MCHTDAAFRIICADDIPDHTVIARFRKALTGACPDRLIALGKSRSVQARAREHPTSGEPPPDATPREAMDHRLCTPEGAKLYKRRGATVEPGIGNFKKLLPRYCLRGLDAVISETHLAATVFNLLKIHRAAPT